MAVESVSESRTASIRRITEGAQRWRVLVETWPECDAFRGRLVFRPDAVGRWAVERESWALLSGESMEEVVARAHALPDAHLRRVLHSLA